MENNFVRYGISRLSRQERAEVGKGSESHLGLVRSIPENERHASNTLQRSLSSDGSVTSGLGELTGAKGKLTRLFNSQAILT